MMTKKKEYFTKNEVKGRGWTEKVINEFLPTPDMTKPNPTYRSASPMKLYLISKVIALEETASFKQLTNSLENRRNAAKTSMKSRADKLLAYVENLIVNVPTISRDKLVKRACTHYNDHQWARGKFESFATPKSDQQFLNRITVNFLRHNLTSYESELAAIFGKVGKEKAYERLRAKIDSAILAKYEWLENRQAQMVH